MNNWRKGGPSLSGSEGQGEPLGDQEIQEVGLSLSGGRILQAGLGGLGALPKGLGWVQHIRAWYPGIAMPTTTPPSIHLCHRGSEK